MRKKTHDEYVAELAIKNPTIEVVDKYINSSTKIKHRCLIHDVYWNITPNNALGGKGCPECHKERSAKSRMHTHEWYVSELKQKNPMVEVVGVYSGYNVPIEHHCLIHDVYWNATPCNVLAGKGCKECMKEKVGKKLVKQHDAYVEELAIKNPTVEVVEEYINSQTPILHHCLIHDVYWKMSPANALNGQRCAKCKEEALRNTFAKSHGQYVDEVAIVNPDIEVVGEYHNAYTPILHRCLIDGNEWIASPTCILMGKGCPVCKESSGERKVRLWLEKRQIDYIREKSFDDCRDKNPLPFDFYLPDYNTLIEVQGQQHYHPVDIFGGEKVFELQKEHDKIKADYCKSNDIRLLRIAYYEDVDEQLNNFLFI